MKIVIWVAKSLFKSVVYHIKTVLKEIFPAMSISKSSLLSQQNSQQVDPLKQRVADLQHQLLAERERAAQLENENAELTAKLEALGDQDYPRCSTLLPTVLKALSYSRQVSGKSLSPQDKTLIAATLMCVDSELAKL
jgi:septal ring factor EnvC (AmiA/AmiB activator)